MRIGVNCFLLRNSIGGLRQYFLRLFRELLKNDKENSYVFFHFEHNISELECIGNDRWKNNSILLSDQMEIAGHIDRMDLYFCPFGAIWPRPLPIPSVVTLVDIQEKYYPEFFTESSLWNRNYHYFASTKTADRVITISKFSKRSIQSHHKIKPKKIDVAYLAANEKFYEPLSSDSMPYLELPERYIFYPANRWYHKNHDNLLKALAILKKDKNAKIDCVLTGFDYENGYPLSEKSREYGIFDQIKVMGFVTPEELRHIYAKAEMLCFPSLFEGFGMPPLEAMAAGCPVICSDTTSLPEVVGDAGLYFDPKTPQEIAECVLKVWNNPALKIELIEKGRCQAYNFSVAKMASVHTNAFKEAKRSFSKIRHLYLKWLFEPLHRRKMQKIKPAGI